MTVRRKYWIAISAALVVVGSVGLVLALHRNRSESPPRSPLPQQSPSQPDAQSALDPTFLVLASMGSTPPGARIVRVSDGFVLGYTPETIEFHQSNQPERVRFELEGYTSVTREVPTAADSVFRIVLEPNPSKHRQQARAPKR
jgi:hypothetical protein